MDLETLYQRMKVATVISWTLWVIVLIGEVVGWWQDLGELGLVLLTITSVLLSIATFFLGATRNQATLAVKGIGEGNVKLDALNTKTDQLLGKQDAMLGKQDAMLGKQDETNRTLAQVLAVLTQIRDRLP